jgi:DNA-binding NtrC family response regulator
MSDLIDILIVDDEPSIVKALARVLRIGGYSLSEAMSGEQALALMERYSYKIVITDYHMPDITGAQIAHIISRKYPDTDCFIITGDEDAVTPEGVTVLQKPWDNEHLLDLVTRSLTHQMDGQC